MIAINGRCCVKSDGILTCVLMVRLSVCLCCSFVLSHFISTTVCIAALEANKVYIDGIRQSLVAYYDYFRAEM